MFNQNIHHEKAIYLSYASGNSDKLKSQIKKLLEIELVNTDYRIIDYQDLEKNGEQYNIEDLIDNIGRGLFVIQIIDKKYLSESIFTLKEICKLKMWGGLRDRVFPIFSDEKQIIYDMKEEERNKILEKMIDTIEDNIPETGITSTKDDTYRRLIGCIPQVQDFLDILEKNVNWAYKSDQYDKLVKRVIDSIGFLEESKQSPTMLEKVSSVDLKSNSEQGGNLHTERNFIYTKENAHLFFERKIVGQIVEKLKPDR